jgi:hypothetical protein
MNIEEIAKRKKTANKGRGRRFYTSVDMSIIKKDDANRKGMMKRGEVIYHGNNVIYECGCGREGCFIHHSYPSTLK